MVNGYYRITITGITMVRISRSTAKWLEKQIQEWVETGVVVSTKPVDMDALILNTDEPKIAATLLDFEILLTEELDAKYGR